jgi:RNA polymerase sigma-70 factor (ECF subfamily)
VHQERSDAEFLHTRWSLIHGLRSDRVGERAEAGEKLIASYWPAVYAFLRRRGVKREDASEITQAFFVDVVLTRDLFQSADRGRGKLRTLMLTALGRYMVDRHRRNSAACRQGILAPIPGDGTLHEEAMLESAASLPADIMFERRWALAQVEEAVRRCREYFVRVGKERHWAAFELRILSPAASPVDPVSLEVVAASLGFPGPADAASAVQVVKKRFRTFLMEVIAETIGDGDDVEAEYRQVIGALS